MSSYFSTPSDFALTELKSTSSGLSYAEAKSRLESNGKNSLKSKNKLNPFLKFLLQFKDVLIIVLLISCVVSIVMGIVNRTTEEFIDAGMIFAVLLINAIIGFVQEQKSEKAMEALKNMTKPYCVVIRQGKTSKIKSEDLVLGDIVLLEAGDIVPADLRLLQSTSLKIEESALTGESVAIEKDASAVLDENSVLGDRINMAYMGTVVTYGRGVGVVVACGMSTEMGKIASAMNEIEDTETPLTKRIKSTSILLTIIVAVVCVAIFVISVIMGTSIFSAFSMSIALAVCVIPEGLPACNTITMSLGVKRMSDQRAIVKSLPAVETLGSTEVICSDKTGTLTLNKMTVKKIFYIGEQCEAVDNFQFPAGVESLPLEQVEKEINLNLKKDRNFVELLRCMILCNDTKIKFEADKLETIGDPTEIALVHYGYKFGISKEKLDGMHIRENELPFDSERKLMTTINNVDNKHVIYTKGALDNILSKCNRILDNGRIRKITNADKEQILKKNSEFASFALRNLGFAFKISENVSITSTTETDLCFLGLVGMIDPPREEVKGAIKTCKEAGIATIMITGDHKDTAFAIAKELGICSDEKRVITGKELDEISDEEFVKLVQNYSVYARVSPDHKVRIVKALKANDKIVAMTGDGVNDAPSIKSADIGVGMGITGTDVTKEAADIILTDDNFATIVGAVKEGRHIYNTILKILMFLLGTSIAELLSLSFIMLVFRDDAFFTPLLLLWINFVSDTFTGMALGFEKPEKDIMKRKPIKNSGNLFKGIAGINILASAIFVSIGIISLYCVSRFALNLSSLQINSICFVYLCLSELLHSYNLKSETDLLFSKNPFDNKILNWSFLASAVLMVLFVVVPIPGLQAVMGLTQINWWQWLMAIGGAILIVPYFEIIKLIMRRKQRKTK